MEKSKDTPLYEEIQKIYNNMTYSEIYSVDIWITILAIVFVIIIVVYIYIYSQIKLQKLNWENNKCNPLFAPFGKIINNGHDGFNEENLQKCLDNLAGEVGYDIGNPLDVILSSLFDTFSFIGILTTQFMSFMINMFNNLVKLFSEFVNMIKYIIDQNVEIFYRLTNYIKSVFGIFTIIYYKIFILVEFIKFLIPLMIIIFYIVIIVPLAISLAVTAVSLATFIIISFIPFVGWWAIPFVAIFSVVLVFTIILFIIVSLLYEGLKSAVRKFTLSVTPKSDDDSYFSQLSQHQRDLRQMVDDTKQEEETRGKE